MKKLSILAALLFTFGTVTTFAQQAAGTQVQPANKANTTTTNSGKASTKPANTKPAGMKSAKTSGKPADTKGASTTKTVNPNNKTTTNTNTK